MHFSGLADPVCEGFHAWVVVCRYQCRLEHLVPQGTMTTGDGPFLVEGSAVVRDRGQSSEFRSLLPVVCADSGISAISRTLATRPIPGIMRRTMAVSASRSSLAMARVIRFSSSLMRLSIRCFNSGSASSNIAAAPRVRCARDWASGRLRISTSWVRLDLNALRMRSFFARRRGLPS